MLLLGQDPYHDDGQAHGMCFSVKPGVKQPPSLVNIFKELNDDLGCEVPDHGNLMPWAEQGMMLLNTVLTVRAHQAGSHKDKGWEEFTDAVIKTLNARKEPLVFLLWGSFAHKKEALITGGQHRIIKSGHPSPLSSKQFFGTRPFSKTNQALKQLGLEPINWQIPDLANLTARKPDSSVRPAGPVAPAPVALPKPAVAAPVPVVAPKPVLAPAAPPQPLKKPLNEVLPALRPQDQLPADWLAALDDELRKPSAQELDRFLADERNKATVCPDGKEVFACFRLTPLDSVRVVLLGTEPPANREEADGLAYSVRPGCSLSPLLESLFEEMCADLGCWMPTTGHLAPWAGRGVLLLNRVLTVREGKPSSHTGKGWETFTDAVLRLLSARSRPLVFAQWGTQMLQKRGLIDKSRHTIVEGPLPGQPGFEGSRPFSAINDALAMRGQSAIYWQLFAG